MLAQKRIMVDNEYITNADFIINKFSKIALDKKIIQHEAPIYLMLNKPVGVVSSTKGGNINERLKLENPTQIQEHPTVMSLIPRQYHHELHYAGRLDLNTSGLMLLTNDSRWSEKISQPEQKVKKRYIVTLQNPIEHHYIEAFTNGIYFKKDNITTRPATLIIRSAHEAEVILEEGKRHQIKRMFGYFNNMVVKLHRSAIGNLTLDKSLAEGNFKLLTESQVNALFDN